MLLTPIRFQIARKKFQVLHQLNHLHIQHNAYQFRYHQNDLDILEFEVSKIQHADLL